MKMEKFGLLALSGGGGGGDTIEAERIVPAEGLPYVQITIHHADGSPDTVTEVYDGQEGPQGPEGPSGGVIIDLAIEFPLLALDLNNAYQAWMVSAMQAGGSDAVISVPSSNTSGFLTRSLLAVDSGALPSILLGGTLFVPTVVNAYQWGTMGKNRYTIENVGTFMLRVQVLVMSGAIEISGSATSWTAPTAS